MLNRSRSGFITAHWCMFSTHHCQLNGLMIRRTLSLANLAFHSNQHALTEQPTQGGNRPFRTVTDVAIMWFHSLELISLVGQVCGTEYDLKQKTN